MARLRKRPDRASRALEFTVLTAARSGEVFNMVWPEVDFAEALWIVPAEKMKAHREHRVPLSVAAARRNNLSRDFRRSQRR